jgi:hypothetical protein
MREKVDAYIARKVQPAGVYRLLEGDADYAGESAEARAILWRYGRRLYTERTGYVFEVGEAGDA